jgi:hypothetical protein
MPTPYSQDELMLLSVTPHLIGSAMASAASSGLFGTGKELFATATSVVTGSKLYPNNPLIKELVLDPQTNMQGAMEQAKKAQGWAKARLKEKGVNSSEKLRATVIEDCRTVASLLASKSSPSEAAEYKQWAMSVAEKVAEAASEGGIMGFGGERISPPEKQLLGEVRGALDVDPRNA